MNRDQKIALSVMLIEFVFLIALDVIAIAAVWESNIIFWAKVLITFIIIPKISFRRGESWKYTN